MVKKLTEYGVSCHVNYDLQNAVYWRIFQLPESFFRSYDSGDLAQRRGQAGSSAAQVVSQVTGAGFGMVFSLFYLWRMIKYSGKLTVWALIMSLVFAPAELLSGDPFPALRDITGRYQRQGCREAVSVSGRRGQDPYGRCGRTGYSGTPDSFTQEQKYEIQGKRITAVSEVLSDVSTYLFSMILYFVIIKKNQDISVGNFMAFNSAFGTFLLGADTADKRLYDDIPPETDIHTPEAIFDTQPEDDEQKQIVQPLSGVLNWST